MTDWRMTINKLFTLILAVIVGSSLAFAVLATDTPEKSDITKGVEGEIREGKTGTLNENAEKQMKELERQEKESQPTSEDSSPASSDKSKAK